MRVVHFSDWHQQRLNLPEADLYICTGDMLPDDDFDDWPVPAESSEMFQSDWVNTFAGTYRNKLFACKDAPLVYVRGNHDFTDFGALFDGGENHQITLDPTIVHQVLGMRIGGFRGVPWIGCGWSDEMRDAEMQKQVQDMPDIHSLDIVVTHTPPKNILDNKRRQFGSQHFRRWIDAGAYDESNNKMPKLFCFGHIHEDNGIKEEYGTIFSNAATTVQVIDI